MRSIGRANEVAAEIEQDEALFAQVFEGLFSAEPRIRMRAADAITKAATRKPALIQPYTERLLQVVALILQQEVQWHVAELIALLQLDATERKAAVKILLHYLDTAQSNIVKVNAMQTLADLAMTDESLRPMARARIESLIETGTPSIRARSNKLLTRVATPGSAPSGSLPARRATASV